jgi:AraC-like DNA-binding protein
MSSVLTGVAHPALISLGSCLRFCVALTRKAQLPRLPTKGRPPHEEWLVERVERMNGQDGTAIFHVGDLAKRLEISEGHLRRIFRRATGMNLREHLNTTRFSLAHALLHAGESVTETALACQYNDVSSFSRAFKLQSGVAPTVYKAWLVEGAQ